MKKLTRYIIGFIIAGVVTALAMSNADYGEDATIVQSQQYCNYKEGKCKECKECGVYNDSACCVFDCKKNKAKDGKK